MASSSDDNLDDSRKDDSSLQDKSTTRKVSHPLYTNTEFINHTRS